jgi:hypothetical protein
VCITDVASFADLSGQRRTSTTIANRMMTKMTRRMILLCTGRGAEHSTRSWLMAATNTRCVGCRRQTTSGEVGPSPTRPAMRSRFPTKPPADTCKHTPPRIDDGNEAEFHFINRLGRAVNECVDLTSGSSLLYLIVVYKTAFCGIEHRHPINQRFTPSGSIGRYVTKLHAEVFERGILAQAAQNGPTDSQRRDEHREEVGL